MTKKFWEDWRKRVDETDKIELVRGLQMFSRGELLSGCVFDSNTDKIRFIHFTSRHVRAEISRYRDGEPLFTETLNIHRVDIKTVKFKKL